ncbi:MAG: DNA primase, partial [Bacillota bacterium]|nr:DNA primase [Bacillota bacterium]
DLKNKYELQQDGYGIYKYITKGKGEEAEEVKIYLTNFNLISATRIRFVDEDHEGVKLVLKSSTGEIIEKLGEAEVFDDTKTFKNFLGTLDLAFKGKVDELTDLKTWINKYFALQAEDIYKGIKFSERNEELMFITNDGALSSKGINNAIRSDKRNDIEVLDIEPITKEELKELKRHIFKFASPDKAISIIGSIINNLAVYQNEKAKQKLHHLLIVGESGSGKSTILEHVIAPILNYPRKDIKSIGLITPFALINDLSNGNYPMLFDEFKPSGLDKYKVAKLSETFRNLYDRATISRGDKTLRSRDFHLNRPIVLVGEESYPNQEKALIERSCIVYLSKRERTEVHCRTMRWIIDNEILLNKLGRALIDVILNLSVEDYMQIRNSVISTIKGLSNRPLNTAVNTCCGIEIFNLLLKQHKLSLVTKYAEHITDNIKNEVLGNEEDAHSTVEQMLILYNEMIEDERAVNVNDVVKYKRNGIFIKTSEMINQIREHVSKVGADINPLGLKDFKKQASKSGYLEVISNKVIRLGMKTVRYDTYNRELLRKLKLYSIVPPEIVDTTDEGEDTIPFD